MTDVVRILVLAWSAVCITIGLILISVATYKRIKEGK